MNKKHLLIISLGNVWELIPEIVLFSNFESLRFQNKNTKEDIKKTFSDRLAVQPYTHIWGICSSSQIDYFYHNLKQFNELFEANIKIILFSVEDSDDLHTVEDCHFVADLIYRVVQSAHSTGLFDKITLSPVGGRKTMSADMIQAAGIFGADYLIHVLSSGAPIRFSPQVLFENPPSIDFTQIRPVLYQENICESPVSFFIQRDHTLLEKIEAFEKSNETIIKIIETGSVNIHTQVNESLKIANDLSYNFYMKMKHNQQLTNFYALYTLSPRLISKINERFFIKSGENCEEKKTFLYSLPKTDLHYHLGGSANIEEIIEIAESNLENIHQHIKRFPELEILLSKVQKWIAEENITELKKVIHNIKNYKYFENVPAPYTIAGILAAFTHKPELLRLLNYEELTRIEHFINIGIERYEKLGDLQGSSLLSSEKSLRTLCRIIKRNAKRDHLFYQEIRCSPCNYESPEMTAEKVIDILYDELSNYDSSIFKLIIIGSRHGNPVVLDKHVRLAVTCKEKYPDFIVGFDLAGNESANEPEKLRTQFLPLMERCIRLTIHAGETAPVDNIWQAVYHLSADRIGHGLYLRDNQELFNRFKNSKIAVELCPGSNYQIVGFRDYTRPESASFPVYPLKEYLQENIKVTINTDDPGISLSNINEEYIKAIQLSEGNISLWEILKIIRNGFKASFMDYDEKEKVIKKVEEIIIKQIKEYYHD